MPSLVRPRQCSLEGAQVSYTREPFADTVKAGAQYIIPENVQVIVTGSFIVEAGGTLIIKPGGKLVVLP